MNNIKHDSLVEDIMCEIIDLDIAGYILQEVRDFLKYVNHYKLANIYENMEDFKDYLFMLDKQNSNQILQLEIKNEIAEDNIQSDLNYYLSSCGTKTLGEEKLSMISKNDYNLNNIMQWIKWYLILTVDEFCNASQTRMSINRMLLKKDYCLA